MERPGIGWEYLYCTWMGNCTWLHVEPYLKCRIEQNSDIPFSFAYNLQSCSISRVRYQWTTGDAETSPPRRVSVVIAPLDTC
jgi:hypothetical protein